MQPAYSYMLAGAVMMASLGLGVYGETQAKDVLGPVLDPGKNAQDKLQQIGNQMADETTAQEARSLLSKVVNDAMTEGKFASVVGYLAKEDRERIGDLKTPKTEDLNVMLAQFRVDFKAKYNQEFDIRPEHFRDAMVYAGHDKNSATVSLPDLQFDRKTDPGKAIPQVDEKIAAKAGKPLVEKVREPGGAAEKALLDQKLVSRATKEDVKGAVADKVGTGLTLNLINEGRIIIAWRINIPNEITGEQLKSNLKKHIEMFDDQKALWPTVADAAYHAAAYHVLQALTDSSLVSER